MSLIGEGIQHGNWLGCHISVRIRTETLLSFLDKITKNAVFSGKLTPPWLHAQSPFEISVTNKVMTPALYPSIEPFFLFFLVPKPSAELAANPQTES